MKVYIEGVDVAPEEPGELLPMLREGDSLSLQQLVPEQHFTQPPARYSEASLVKTLEEYGIGRPSTYASTMSTLLEKKYARLDKKRFFPEDVGMVVNDLLANHFAMYVDYNFTAKLEDELDEISRGKQTRQPFLKAFWDPFLDLLGQKETEISKEDVTTTKLDETCPVCNKNLVIRLGRNGKFIACSGFKGGCRYTRNLEGGEAQAEPALSEEKCTECGKPMLIKEGRYGKYLSCSGYPECKNKQNLNKPKETGVACPECGQGKIIEKKSAKGKKFYSCNRYPQCKYILWDHPVEKPCQKCGSPLLIVKVTKRDGKYCKCPKAGCDYREAWSDELNEKITPALKV